ncbi:MAG: OmpP1/FadL family transporter [Stygiobacter sp.]
MKKLLTLFVACSFFTSISFAGGFQINEQGARAMSLAGAFAGLANDPSAIYFNPAGIVQLKGTKFYFGTTTISPIASFTLGENEKARDYEMKGQLFTPINFYATQQLSNKLFVGLGVNNQYGLGTKWDANWVGRFLAVNTEIRTFFFTPVVAYKLLDNLSFSVGGSFVMADVTIERKAPNPNPTQQEPMIAMEGNTTGYGFTAGLLFNASEKLQLGLSYRSEVKLDFSGTATSTPATFTHPLLKINLPFPNGDITAPLTTPQNITFGLAYMPQKDLTLTADFQYVGWKSYDKLEVTFKTYDLDLNPANGQQNVSTAIRDYQNTFILRGGLEYTMTDNLQLRAGLLYDKNPVKTEYVDPTLPDADRLGFNIGFGGKLTDKLGIDFAYMLLTFQDRKVTGSVLKFNGTYSNTAHLFGFNLSYSL